MTFTMCVTVNILYHELWLVTDVRPSDVRALKSSHREFRTELKRMPCSKDSLMFTETENDTAQCPRTTPSNEHQYKGYIFVCEDNQTKVKRQREKRHLN